MNIDEIKDILKFLDKSSLAYLEIKEGDFYIKIDKSLNRDNSVSEKHKDLKSSNIEENPVKHNDKIGIIEEEALSKDESFEKEGEVIVAPMVGTFYGAASPGSEPFIKIGDRVDKGKVLCIIEAMKLMNEIECEIQGEVIEILVQDGDMVEYGQPLFKIKRS